MTYHFMVSEVLDRHHGEVLYFKPLFQEELIQGFQLDFTVSFWI